MRRLRSRIPLSLLLLLFFAHPVRAERLPLKVYTVADGLANNNINCIVPDSRGFLWFCTADGLSLFDGYRFTNFGTDEGLPHPNVSGIVETKQGYYWVATNAGLCRFDPNGVPRNRPGTAEARATAGRNAMFTIFVPHGPADAAMVTSLLHGRDGTTWVGTRRGLFRITHGAALLAVDIRLRSGPAEESLVTSLAEDRHGSLWIGTPSGLYRRWQDGRSARYDIRDGLPDENIHDVLEDRRGRLWVGTRYGGLAELVIDDGHAAPVVRLTYQRRTGFLADWIFDLHESTEGMLWIGTNFGLVQISTLNEIADRSIRHYPKRSGFTYHEIKHLAEDRDGNLWLGAENGVMKMSRYGFVTFGEDDGIGVGHSVFESTSGELYAFAYVLQDQVLTPTNAAQPRVPGSAGMGGVARIGRFDGRQFSWILPNVLRGNASVSWSNDPFLLLARSGEWWIGTIGGVYVFPRVARFEDLQTVPPLAVYTTKDGLAVPRVHALYEDSRANIWISTEETTGNGLARWDAATRTVRDLAGTEGLPSLSDRLPVSFREDRSGGIWIGFSPDGVARFAAGRFRFFAADSGLPPGKINDLYLDSDGRLWIATSRGGLSRVDRPDAEHPVFVTFSTTQGLSSNLTTAITGDRYGRIYAGTGRGIDRITPATGKIQRFTTAEGVPHGAVTAAFTDSNGAMWFATSQGFSRFIPEPERSPAPPAILINGLRTAGQTHHMSPLGESSISAADMSHNRNYLQVQFFGVSFASGETLRYQYKLEGARSDWSVPTEQRVLDFASLAPGDYRFLVRAVNSEGIGSVTPAVVSFTVLPPLWQRMWFISLGLTILAALLYALYRYRVSKLVELERVRTRIATDLHDEIGSNLSLIAMVSDVAGRSARADSRMANWLSLIADTSRDTVDAMSDIVWVVNPQKDRIGDLTQRMRRLADDAFTAANVRFRFMTSTSAEIKIGVDTRREVFMIFKEALNNILRHARCSEAEIDLAIQHGRLELRLTDNGRGFDTSDAADGNGLASMRRRAARVGGELDVRSDPGRGSTVTLRVPLAAPLPIDAG